MANRTRTRNGAKQRGGDPAKSKDAPPARISATRDGGVAGVNRRERKEEARRQREALLRKQARRRAYRVGMIAGAAVLALVLVLVFTVFKKSSHQVLPQNQLPGLIRSADTRLWETPNTTDLDKRVVDLGLPSLGAEQLAFHIHQELEIFVNGQRVTVPAHIGIASAADLAVIHVHATDGVIHVESPVQRTFTLGQFFGVWGVYFDRTTIGGFHAGNGKSLRVYVNGKPYSGDPTKLALTNHEVIVVTFGTAAQVPNPIPKTFDFANSTAGG